ncbi:MAG: ABC transporter permease subunit [Eubacteriales bacterium]|nr:ABC transporter permease subunit [Eubacteriales bacterium]
METKVYRKRKKIRKNILTLYAMMIPGFIYIFINNYMPLPGLAIAFKRFDYSKGIWDSPWTGLSNFTYLFKSQDALNMVRNTLGYNLVFIILGNVIAVAVAVMLNFLKGKMNKKVYQTLILMPYLVSTVVVSYIVYAFLGQESGFLNSLLVSMGKDKISWYTSPKYWPYILTIVFIWKNFGYSSILYYAAVIGIDSSLYEAAMVDGAGRMRQVWHVTLPGLKNTIITMVLLQIGKMFYSDFGLFYQVPMRSGLITSVTDTIDVFVYRNLSMLNDIGRASAAGFLQSMLGFALILAVNFIVRRVDRDSALF